jgi:hypothetical protein
MHRCEWTGSLPRWLLADTPHRCAGVVLNGAPYLTPRLRHRVARRAARGSPNAHVRPVSSGCTMPTTPLSSLFLVVPLSAADRPSRRRTKCRTVHALCTHCARTSRCAAYRLTKDYFSAILRAICSPSSSERFEATSTASIRVLRSAPDSSV